MLAFASTSPSDAQNWFRPILCVCVCVSIDAMLNKTLTQTQTQTSSVNIHRILHNRCKIILKCNTGQENVFSSERMAEIKNVLINLVREHPFIYDKAHPFHYRINVSCDER